MNNAELIKALRHCGKGGDIAERCLPCDYYDREPWCEAALVNDAADALEAAEAQLPKEGEWIMGDPKNIVEATRIEKRVVRSKWDVALLNKFDDDRHNLLARCRCMECGKDITVLATNVPNYCPNCGARMTKGESNEQ